MVLWKNDVDIDQISEFLRESKWGKVRDKISLINSFRRGSHQVKISNKALTLRKLLLPNEIDIFPAFFRTYDINKGQGQWSWEVFESNLLSYGSCEPASNVFKTGYLCIVSGDEIFSCSQNEYERCKTNRNSYAVHFRVKSYKSLEIVDLVTY